MAPAPRRGRCTAVLIGQQARQGTRRWHQRRVEGVALAARKGARLIPQPAGRQPRRVMLQVFLEQRVVGRQHRQLQAAGSGQAGIVGDEGGLDVDRVAVARRCEHCAMHGPPADQPVFGIARQRPAGDANDAGFIRFVAVTRHDQTNLDATGGQRSAERFDRGRHPIDAREVDIGHHQDAHSDSSISSSGISLADSHWRTPQATSSSRPSRCSTMAVQESTQSPQLI